MYEITKDDWINEWINEGVSVGSMDSEVLHSMYQHPYTKGVDVLQVN